MASRIRCHQKRVENPHTVFVVVKRKRWMVETKAGKIVVPKDSYAPWRRTVPWTWQHSGHLEKPKATSLPSPLELCRLHFDPRHHPQGCKVDCTTWDAGRSKHSSVEESTVPSEADRVVPYLFLNASCSLAESLRKLLILLQWQSRSLDLCCACSNDSLYQTKSESWSITHLIIFNNR